MSFIILTDDIEQKDIVYQIVLEVEKNEEDKKFIVCQKANFEEPLVFFELIKVEEELAYKEVENEDDHFYIESILKQIAENEKAV
ncbi:hypothetical protein NSQ59_27390 [Margalitia sp. FSL K6-0131]|uniref:hypothetical protein n=1 Tax=Margalitia sp. FSL K6-0131 TaxID=2954604 RepID=UPI0030F8C0AC